MTYFEINYLITNILYPGIYHMALHISREIDLPPEAELKGSLKETQRQLTRCLTAIEVVSQRRLTDPESKFYVDTAAIVADTVVENAEDGKITGAIEQAPANNSVK